MTRRLRLLVGFAILAYALCISGCHAPPPQYIPVPCKQPEDRTAPFPADNLSPAADIFTQVQTLLWDRQERKSDRLVLTTALKACR